MTAGSAPAVRVRAPDLKAAQKARGRIRGEEGQAGVSVVLDVTVLVAADFQAARRLMPTLDTDPGPGASLQYAGTLDGLAGLIADIFVAGVADGVTLIPAAGQQNVTALADATLARIAERLPVAA